MAAQAFKISTATLLLATTFYGGSALAQNPNIQTAISIAPIRPDFTRPGGMPGAPRATLAGQELYMRAVPSEPPQPVKKKRRRRRH